jgi:ATP-binding cassette subfamily C protein CydC
MSTTIRHLIATERRRQRGRLLVAGGCAAAGAAAAVLLLGLSGWFITGAALAGLAGPASAGAFNYLLPSAAIRLLAILRTGSRYAERLVGHDAALRALARIRPALFGALAASPPGEALAISTGEATARMVQDVDAVEARFVRLSTRWGMMASLLTGSTLLLLAGPAPAAATATIFAAALFLAHRLATVLQAPGREVQGATGGLKEEFATLAAATAELRAYGLEDWAAARIAARSEALAGAQLRVTAGAGWFDLLQASAVGLAAMAALVLSADGPLPMAALAALGAAMTVDGAAGFARGLERRGSTREAEARLDAVLDWAREGQAAPGRAIAARPVIRFSPVVAVPPGTIAGLTGPSGCGKTSLLEALAGLRDIVPGRIALGGADLALLDPATARACFALAPQDAALLAGTVRDNLRLADPAASDAALWEALQDAALDRRVAALPQGLDSWLGENGARLSGGERRRLVLARALLRPVPWLLLDEPSEGLDAATEAEMLERLQSRMLRRNQGALIVTHRPAPLGICHQVLRVAPGPVVLPADRQRSAA